MDYRSLGRSGISVSPYCLGAMMFGAFRISAEGGSVSPV
jgi:aryl-alcohol dehydrogenase-like predicted oxidoreductase